jgi:photosystem II stability/assembly factor-like uncharacterized protein
VGSLPTNSTVRALQIDPRKPERVYAAGPAGVFRSDDAGETWQPAGKGLEDVTIVALALHPKQPDTLFAATAQGVLFRSDDGATSWRSLAP